MQARRVANRSAIVAATIATVIAPFARDLYDSIKDAVYPVIAMNVHRASPRATVVNSKIVRQKTYRVHLENRRADSLTDATLIVNDRRRLTAFSISTLAKARLQDGTDASSWSAGEQTQNTLTVGIRLPPPGARYGFDVTVASHDPPISDSNLTIKLAHPHGFVEFVCPELNSPSSRAYVREAAIQDMRASLVLFKESVALHEEAISHARVRIQLEELIANLKTDVLDLVTRQLAQSKQAASEANAMHAWLTKNAAKIRSTGNLPDPGRLRAEQQRLLKNQISEWKALRSKVITRLEAISGQAVPEADSRIETLLGLIDGAIDDRTRLLAKRVADLRA